MASIRKRNGHYQITVSLGYDIYGKKLIETASFTPDPTRTEKQQERDLQQFARKFEDEVKSGIAQDGRRITFKAFSERWLAEYAATNLQPGTITKYTQELESKIYPAIGHLKLSDLKPGILNSFFVGLGKDGARKDGKPGGYSKASITKTRNVVSAILRTAAEWELIDRNPCEKVKLSAGVETAEQIKFFTPEQAKTFLSYIEAPYSLKVSGHQRVDDTGIPYTVGDYKIHKEIPEQIRILFNLAIYTGLRKGEILALEFADVDFENDIVSITKAATVVNGVQVCKQPKTKMSVRTVTIPHDMTLRILALRKTREQFKADVGDFWQGGDWIFVQDNGQMMNYSTPYQALQDVLRRYNTDKPPEEQLPIIPFHGLRHTAATLLIAAGVDVRTISARLGHALTSTTLNIYIHALRESDQKAADAISSLLEKGL